MSEQRKIRDASDAEAAVRRLLEAKYGDKIKEFFISKSWFSAVGTTEFWDVEGTLHLKKGNVKQINTRYQVDPISGAIFGFQETPIRK
jgi:hypothetical protein